MTWKLYIYIILIQFLSHYTGHMNEASIQIKTNYVSSPKYEVCGEICLVMYVIFWYSIIRYVAGVIDV